LTGQNEHWKIDKEDKEKELGHVAELS